MAIDIDAVFREIGEFGPFQRRIFFLLCLPSVLVGCGNLAYVFIAATPKYRCAIAGCDNKTFPIYDEYFVNYTIPYLEDGKHLDQCHHFVWLNTSIPEDARTCSPDDFSMTNVSTCENGTVFEKTTYRQTVVTEFDLTCKDAWEANMVQTIYFGGILAGSLIFGFLGDRIGRMLTLTIGIVGMAAFGVTTALVSTLPGFNFTRFMSAFMTTGVFQTGYILALEFVGPKMRVTCGIIPQYFFAIGEVVLGLLAWGIKDWRMIQLLISGPVSCFVFYWFFIPESPRWLQARGKHRKAVAVLQKMAMKNGKTIPLELLQVSEEISDGTDDTDTLLDATKVSMVDVVRKPVLCVRMIAMFYIWIVVTLVYYGLSLNAVSLGDSDSTSAPFVDFILTSLVEIPGYSLSWLCMSWWGRKWTVMFSLIFAGLSCGGAGFASEYGADYVIIPYLFGKCFITCTFASIYMFTMEMFPTKVRSTVLGLCSTFARVGAMLAPFSSELSDVYGPLPMIVFGVLSLMAGILNVLMPETKNTTLPETIADAVNLGSGSPLYTEIPLKEPHVPRRELIVRAHDSRSIDEVQSLLAEDIEEDDSLLGDNGNSNIVEGVNSESQ